MAGGGRDGGRIDGDDHGREENEKWSYIKF